MLYSFRPLLLISVILMLLVCCQSASENKNDHRQKTTREPVSLSSTIALPMDYEFPNGNHFSILSWNVEHFVDPYDDPYINNAREDNPPENMAARTSLLLQAIRIADADIVLLQEFESAKYLRKLAEDSLSDMGYQFFADAPSLNWYMNVVVMSKVPMGMLHSYGRLHTALPDYTTQDGKLETQQMINTRMWTLQIFPDPNYDFWLTGVHLKAGRNERDIAMRKGQINVLMDQYTKILQQDKEANLLMAGDFNAYPTSEELDLLKSGNDQFSGMIDPLDTGVYTHPANDPRRRLDYIIYNDGMAKEVAVAVAVQNFFSPDSMRMISDHLPLMASFLKENRQ